jgi:predicted AlkP superfamily pyrophosphatase or phosphodiesterase
MPALLRLWIGISVGWLGIGAAVPVAAQPAGRPADHVILISIDGLLPDYCLRPEAFGLSLPALASLGRAGSVADGVVGQYPSLTYPSHTSIVTGVRPARHGIVHNTKFAPAGSGGWYFESEAIRVPTLWDAARTAGLKTAGVSWPVTVGSSIDVLYPEGHQSPPDRTWLELAREQSTPGLIDAIVRELGGFGPNDNRDPIQRDRFAATAARHIIVAHRPNLLLVHLVETDFAQHAEGPHSPRAKEAFRRVDAHVGAIVRATEEAGIRTRTAFVITGDHGFYRVHSVLQPNVILRQAGLLGTDATGRIVEWQAIAHGSTIRLQDPGDGTLARRVAGLFRDLAAGRYRDIFRVIDREELDALGSDPDAVLALEPVEGYYWSGGFEEDAFIVATTRRGAHGYLPANPRMHTGLILSGAGIRKGVPLPLARQVDIAPTIARLLGFEMRDVDGTAMVGVLETRPMSVTVGGPQPSAGSRFVRAGPEAASTWSNVVNTSMQQSAPK